VPNFHQIMVECRCQDSLRRDFGENSAHFPGIIAKNATGIRHQVRRKSGDFRAAKNTYLNHCRLRRLSGTHFRVFRWFFQSKDWNRLLSQHPTWSAVNRPLRVILQVTTRTTAVTLPAADAQRTLLIARQSSNEIPLNYVIF
jgi:hypothetical protein